MVDDQPDVADMLAAVLERLAQEVKVAYGAETAGVSSKQYLRGLLFELVSAGVTSWMLKHKIPLRTVCDRECRQ